MTLKHLIYVCMYVCTYVCMYVCMYVRMYVCMYVRMYVCMYVCMYVRTYVMYVRIYVCMYVRGYVPTYVHVRTYIRVCVSFKPLISQKDYNNTILHNLGEITPSPLNKEVHHSNVCLCGWDLLNGAHQTMILRVSIPTHILLYSVLEMMAGHRTFYQNLYLLVLTKCPSRKLLF